MRMAEARKMEECKYGRERMEMAVHAGNGSISRG